MVRHDCAVVASLLVSLGAVVFLTINSPDPNRTGYEEATLLSSRIIPDVVKSLAKEVVDMRVSYDVESAEEGVLLSLTRVRELSWLHLHGSCQTALAKEDLQRAKLALLPSTPSTAIWLLCLVVQA